MKLKMRLAVAALLTIGLSSAAAYADTITFTLTNANGSLQGAPGGSLTYDATVSASASNGAAVFLNGDSFNITGPFTLNDSDFLNDFPLSLAPGVSFTGPLFVVTAAPGVPFGTFVGGFEIFGGGNSGAGIDLTPGNTGSFALITTPEPSSIVLLLTGMAGLARARFKGSLRGWVR